MALRIPFYTIVPLSILNLKVCSIPSCVYTNFIIRLFSFKNSALLTSILLFLNVSRSTDICSSLYFPTLSDVNKTLPKTLFTVAIILRCSNVQCMFSSLKRKTSGSLRNALPSSCRRNMELPRVWYVEMNSLLEKNGTFHLSPRHW